MGLSGLTGLSGESGLITSSNPRLLDLISWWTLDEESGQRNDSHGTNHLTDIGTVTYMAGKKANASLHDSAIPEYLSCDSNPSLQIGDIDFTIGGWMYVTDATARRTLCGKGTSVHIIAFTSAAIYGYYGANYSQVYGLAILNTWTFCVFWRDKVANKIYIEINNGDGTLVSGTGTAVATNDTAFTLGLWGTNYMHGGLDECFFYKRMLSATERTWLYNTGAGRTYADLL